MTGTAVKIYLIFLCVNIVLMLGGFNIASNANILGHTYGLGGASDGTGAAGFIYLLQNLISFFLGGGITGLLVSAGMPIEIQYIVGAPMFVLAVLALGPLITGALSIMGRFI